MAVLPASSPCTLSRKLQIKLLKQVKLVKLTLYSSAHKGNYQLVAFYWIIIRQYKASINAFFSITNRFSLNNILITAY